MSRWLCAIGWAICFGCTAVFCLWLAWRCVGAALAVHGGFAVFAVVLAAIAVLSVASGVAMAAKTLEED